MYGTGEEKLTCVNTVVTNQTSGTYVSSTYLTPGLPGKALIRLLIVVCPVITAFWLSGADHAEQSIILALLLPVLRTEYVRM